MRSGRWDFVSLLGALFMIEQRRGGWLARLRGIAAGHDPGTSGRFVVFLVARKMRHFMNRSKSRATASCLLYSA
jgi:hypothetical protein